MDLALHTKAQLEKLVGADYRDRHYLLAVSGGADSMALLDVLCKVLPAGCLTVAHFNHRLRGEASDCDEALVKAEAERRGVAFVRHELRSSARDEASLRRARRSFLRRERERASADFIVLAHHAEDQLETFLMRLVRGAGVAGLSAMRPRRSYWLRPWLDVPRDCLREYAARHALRFHEDATNASRDYLRNRLRHDVLPPLFEATRDFGGKQSFLARLDGTLEDLAEVAREKAKRARADFRKLVVDTPFFLRLERERYLELRSARRLALLREIARGAGGRDWGRAWLKKLDVFIADNRRAISLPGPVALTASCGFLYFQDEARRRVAKAPLQFEKSGTTFHCEAIGVRLSLPEGMELEPRFPRAGDRFGRKKLKEELLRRRIPAPERRLLPVLAKPGSAEVRSIFPFHEDATCLEDARSFFVFR